MPIADLCGACKTILSDCTKAAKALQTAKGKVSKLKSGGNKNSQASKGIFNFFQKCLPMVWWKDQTYLASILPSPLSSDVIACRMPIWRRMSWSRASYSRTSLFQFQAQSAVDALSCANFRLRWRRRWKIALVKLYHGLGRSVRMMRCIRTFRLHSKGS